MEIQFKGTNYHLASDMTELAERKLQGLKKFLGKPEKPAQAYVDLGKVTEAHQNGAIWYADANIDVNGESFNAKAEGENLRLAIERMVKEMAMELRSAKQKRETLKRKDGGRLKNMFRFGF
jgi:ribosomal subunit interface protein